MTSSDEATSMVEALLSRWAEGFSGETPAAILSCYADDATLLGTLSPALRQTPAAIREYFEPFYAFTSRKVEFHRKHIRVYGEAAVCSGTYTFSWHKDGRQEAVAARYSFTCVRRDGRWQIVDHHSSVLPA